MKGRNMRRVRAALAVGIAVVMLTTTGVVVSLPASADTQTSHGIVSGVRYRGGIPSAGGVSFGVSIQVNRNSAGVITHVRGVGRITKISKATVVQVDRVALGTVTTAVVIKTTPVNSGAALQAISYTPWRGVTPGTCTYYRTRANFSVRWTDGALSKFSILSTLARVCRPAPTPPRTFGAGTHRVGIDILSGTYRTRSNRASCYWERLSGLGGTLDEIISNDFTNVSAIVTISPTDVAFHTDSDCGTWTNDLSRITPSTTSPFPGGTYIVGTDIAAGVWRSSAASGCYSERLSGFGGTLDEIISNDFTNSIATVSISASDRGFHATENCGTWTKIG